MRGTEPDKETTLFLPPCERAQADGVPCTELGRNCEVCEQACEERRARQSAQANGEG